MGGYNMKVVVYDSVNGVLHAVKDLAELTADDAPYAHCYIDQEFSADDIIFNFNTAANMFIPSVPIIKTAAEINLAAVRKERDRLLAASDVRVLADRWAAMTAEQQATWAAYRQALRDITAIHTDLLTTEWPVPPAN
jgi:hypothetical protein